MKRSARCCGGLLIVLAAILPSCSPRVSPDDLPPAEETMIEIGRRLGRSLTVQELAALAQRGDRLLARLTCEERAALARGGLRLHVDRPVLVDVAAPAASLPFWLGDLGFKRVDAPLRVAGAEWIRFQRRFDSGPVALGVNGLDRTPGAHYAVFVRAVGVDDGESRPPVVSGIDPDRWRIVPAGEGVSAAFDRELPLGPLPDELLGSLLIQPAHDRRHATRLAGGAGRVWKTHVVAGRRPDQVAVAFGVDPARSLVWTWRTEPGLRATALRLAPLSPGEVAPDPSRPVRILAGDSHLIESPDVLNDPVVRRHRVTATGLTPATAYAYSLGDGSPSPSSSSGGWTPWRVVHTGPDRPRSFQFLYLGDPQCGLEAWGRLLADARRRHPDAAFLLIAGDLVDRGNERTNWDHFFLRAAGVFDELPLLPCAGNHEYLDRGPQLYRASFALPGNGPAGIDSNLVYSFEYAGAFVAVLDSTLALADDGAARVQAEWLDAALGRTKAPWKLVLFHHPVYASHPTRESPALLAAWGPVFDRHHVDLVLQGHDHAYLRTHPLRAGRRVASPSEGTTYVVAVSGTKYYDQRPRAETTAVGFTHLSTYQTIDIQVPEDRLVYRAWDGAGREVDRVTIEKPSDPPRCSTTIRP
jgi:hypothetical protein